MRGWLEQSGSGQDVLEGWGMLSAFIAFLAAAITFGQWRTAQQTLVLGLFEHRYELFRAIQMRLRYLYDDLDNLPRDEVFDFAVMAVKARMLFGRDFNEALQELISILHKVARNDQLPLDDPRRQDADFQGDHFQAGLEKLEAAAVRYIKMEQALPMTPWKWVLHRYRNRPTGLE